MCRILLAVGNGYRMRPLVEALIKASENDPYKAARGKGSQHRDGWGYVLLSKDGVEHYKSRKPIFEDENAKELMKKLPDFGVLLLHSRAASQGNVNVFNAQPFSYASPHGYQLYFMHNGDLIKDLLLEGLKLPRERYANISDSYLAGLYLSLFISAPSEKEIVERLTLLKSTVRTSLNTGGVIFKPNDEVIAFGTAYMREDLLEEEAERNYMRLMEFYSADLFALMSSTLELYTFLPLTEVRNGKAFVVSVNLKDEEFKVSSFELEIT
ncbi:class II glutamine amidotransferase [Pyrococcus sp. NA2]|uniref:class II glutamine amidotransferase n=1 Tax=Pyrococcus sp. (strain NA2) TaxID=342949 RepID=UPI00064FC088|nr:class II glutamine amidotransferase [Pyrococcus sp. NA2]